MPTKDIIPKQQAKFSWHQCAAKGGLINQGKKFPMANEHNWTLATPELIDQQQDIDV